VMVRLAAEGAPDDDEAAWAMATPLVYWRRARARSTAARRRSSGGVVKAMVKFGVMVKFPWAWVIEDGSGIIAGRSVAATAGRAAASEIASVVMRSAGFMQSSTMRFKKVSPGRIFWSFWWRTPSIYGDRWRRRNWRRSGKSRDQGTGTREVRLVAGACLRSSAESQVRTARVATVVERMLASRCSA